MNQRGVSKKHGDRGNRSKKKSSLALAMRRDYRGGRKEKGGKRRAKDGTPSVMEGRTQDVERAVT